MKTVAMVVVLCMPGVCGEYKRWEKRNVWCQQVKYGYTWTSYEFEGKWYFHFKI